MEFAKEEVQVTLINGTKTSVWVHKYINMPQKQDLLKRFTDNLRYRGGDIEWGVNLPGLQKGILDYIWCSEENKGVEINDIVPESIESYISGKVKDFLKMGMGDTIKKSTDS